MKHEQQILDVIRRLGGAVKREAIARELLLLSNLEISNALRAMARAGKIYCINRRYWAICHRESGR
jgi:hypothetical protein